MFTLLEALYVPLLRSDMASFQKARAFSALQIAGDISSDAAVRPENEEGRSKNEEAASDGSDLPSTDSVVDAENAVQESDSLHSELPTQHTAAPEAQPAAPAYLETLLNALKRGQEAGDPDGTILLTEEEMHRLLNDPEFCRFEPEMAENLRRIVNDSG